MKIKFFCLVPVLAGGALMLGACADEGNGPGPGYVPGPGYGSVTFKATWLMPFRI
jgi:hypothetical protein